VGALDGKGALVTGGSRGIGRAIVKRLAADGAAVVFSYLQNEAAAREVVRDVTGAKGALENVTKVAAIEFGRRGITANVVSPGATDTEMLRAANPGDTFEDTAARTALRRLGQPADIAAVVAFLAGPDSGWISGQNLAADGGLLP
jgi:3-oxoacyl-[acyl-carrier protein] reductase